ncbi:MAG: YjbQ family protein, partial [Planctomycetota bacterium]
PGLVKTDLKAALEKFAPADGHYAHEATWHDDNGHSHVRSTLLGPSLSVPFDKGGMLMTGTWQQIVLVDFDTRSRRRTVIATVL